MVLVACPHIISTPVPIPGRYAIHTILVLRFIVFQPKIPALAYIVHAHHHIAQTRRLRRKSKRSCTRWHCAKHRLLRLSWCLWYCFDRVSEYCVALVFSKAMIIDESELSLSSMHYFCPRVGIVPYESVYQYWCAYMAPFFSLPRVLKVSFSHLFFRTQNVHYVCILCNGKSPLAIILSDLQYGVRYIILKSLCRDSHPRFPAMM